MKRHWSSILFVAVALTLVAGGCARDRDETATTTPGTADQPQDEMAMVRVVNAAPDAKALDVFADDQPIFTGVDYKSVTPYKEMQDERFTFRVRSAGQTAGEPLAENSEGLSGGEHYTFVAIPEEQQGQVTLLALSDKMEPSEEGKAKVRVVNASPDAGEVNVHVQGRDEALFSGVNFQSETFFTEVDPSNVSLEIRQQGKKNPLLTVEDVNFEAGKLYTFVVAGSGKQIEAIRIEDDASARATAGRGTNR